MSREPRNSGDDFDRDDLGEKLLREFFKDEQEMFDETPPGISLKMIVPVIALVIVGIVSYAWYTDKFAINSNDEEIPLIKADKAPVRIKPDDPGGMKIANMDKKIYQTFGNDQPEKLPKVMRLNPTPEEPIDRQIIKNEDDINKLLSDLQIKTLNESNDTRELSVLDSEALPAKLPETNKQREEKLVDVFLDADSGKRVIKKQELAASEINLEDLTTGATEEKAEKKQEEITEKFESELKQSATVKEVVKPVIPIKKSEPKIETPEAVTVDDIQVVSKPESKKVAMLSEASNQPKGYKVQLGSFKSPADVENSWINLQARFSSMLSGLNHYTEKADLGSKGVFYRLKAGGFDSKSDALELCSKLKEKNQGCIIVRK